MRNDEHPLLAVYVSKTPNDKSNKDENEGRSDDERVEGVVTRAESGGLKNRNLRDRSKRVC